MTGSSLTEDGCIDTSTFVVADQVLCSRSAFDACTGRFDSVQAQAAPTVVRVRGNLTVSVTRS